MALISQILISHRSSFETFEESQYFIIFNCHISIFPDIAELIRYRQYCINMKKIQMEISWNIATSKSFLEIHLKYFFKCFQSAYLHPFLTFAFNHFRKVCEFFKNYKNFRIISQGVLRLPIRYSLAPTLFPIIGRIFILLSGTRGILKETVLWLVGPSHKDLQLQLV